MLLVSMRRSTRRLDLRPPGVSPCRTWIALVSLAAGFWAAPAAALTIVPLAADRSVVAEAQLSTAEDFARERNASGPPDLGAFVDEVAAVVDLSGGVIRTRAAQDSRVAEEGRSLAAIGAAGAQSVLMADPAFPVARGESFFQMSFTAVGADPLRLTGLLEVAAEAPAEGFVRIELAPLAGGAAVLSRRLDASGESRLDVQLVLDPDTPYVLTALARAEALETSMAASGFEVRLAPVPGPGAAPLAALGAAMAMRRRRADTRGARRAWR